MPDTDVDIERVVQDGYWLGQFEKMRKERDALRAENERLREDNEQYVAVVDEALALRAENDRLRAAEKEADAENGGLAAENEQLQAELNAYKYAIEKIQEALAKYHREHRFAYTLRSIATWAEMPPIEIAAAKERARLVNGPERCPECHRKRGHDALCSYQT